MFCFRLSSARTLPLTVQTGFVDKINYLVILFTLLSLAAIMPTNAQTNSNIEFNLEETKLWRPLNDGVMGGISQGKLTFYNDKATFTGLVSTKYNGGFSSVVRNSVSVPEKTTNVTLHFIGDGKEYQFRFIRYIQGYRVAYKQSFTTTKGKRQKVTFSLEDFVASYRGRAVENAPELRPNDIEQISILAGFKQETVFELTLFKIEFS